MIFPHPVAASATYTLHQAISSTQPVIPPSSPESTETSPLLSTPASSLLSSTNIETTTKGTVLYLAYGSNLCSETFRGRRGIKPLSAQNVLVPSLDLTFDLAGLPYIEPCFANTQYHTSTPRDPRYHKNLWKKGLVGVVYEVTIEDYRTIIATEGGGASYQDVVVDCFPLPKGTEVVDVDPTDKPVKAHTLLCPRAESKAKSNRVQRPDPAYAQPSARYLKLITDGADEHDLPGEYKEYLHNIRAYTITTYRQRIGQGLFATIFVPVMLALITLGNSLAGKDGKIPAWLAKIMDLFSRILWGTYDGLFRRVFGDGERTNEGKKKALDEEMGCGNKWCEKTGLPN